MVRRAAATMERMRVRARITALVLSSAVAGAVLAAHPLEASAFQGTVVDGDTGEPLERAVVVVIWHRSAVVALDSRTIIHKAVERLTDSRGEFSADDSAPLLSLLFKKREAMIFKPGYQTFTRVADDHRTPLFSERVVRLKKIRTLGDARGRSHSTLFICSPAFPPHDLCVPESQLPNLVRVLEIESRIYEPYPASRVTVDEDR